MLRPATPLTVVLLISFVFLLLSTLSSPIIPSIPIATFQGIHFGVFGYCTPDKGCSGIRVGYTTDNLFQDGENPDFNLPSQARRSLSSLLIVHPIAAFLNLVVLALAAAAHLHSPSHSARYLLGVLILLLPTLLITLLAFLVDILLFVPHLQWGGWIVLGSTVLITAAGVITCAMRRTLVSRKARKRRIAENAEMSGENFYNRQAAQDAKMASATVPAFTTIESKTPMVNGAPGADNLPSFTTYTTDSRSPVDTREPMRRGPPSITSRASRDGQSTRSYGGPPSRSNSLPRDQYGNAIPPGGTAGTIPPMPGYENRGPPPPGPGPYRDGMPPPRGGYGPPRGRGGYPPRGRGPPRGPPPQGYRGRGGYPGPGRGGYPPPGPPRGPDGALIGAAVAGGAAGAMMSRGMRPPPPGYGPGPGPDDRNAVPGAFQPSDRAPMSPSIYSTQDHDGYEGYGRRSQSSGQHRPSRNGSRGPSPAGGMRQPSPPPAVPALPSPQAAEMDGQGVPSAAYVPARAGWNNSAAELPSSSSNVGGRRGPRERVNSGGSDIYYEDVDPRFAPSEPIPTLPHQTGSLPPVLAAGPPHQQPYHDESPDSLHVQPPPLTASYEDLPGARSPAESETSNFTSVSQRGVNPNWRPGYPGDFNGPGPMRRQSNTAARQNILLDGNPDFQLPGMATPGRRPLRGRGGYGPPMGRMPPVADGPYPRGSPMIPDAGVREI